MKSLNLDFQWLGEYNSRSTSTTIDLPFNLRADLAAIYEGQDGDGEPTFSYRVEVFDTLEEYGLSTPVWVYRSSSTYQARTHLRAQLQAVMTLLGWVDGNVLGYSPDSPDGVICRFQGTRNSVPADFPPAALEPVSDGGLCEWHNCYTDAQAELNGRRYCGKHAEVALAHYVSTSGDLGD